MSFSPPLLPFLHGLRSWTRSFMHHPLTLLSFNCSLATSHWLICRDMASFYHFQEQSEEPVMAQGNQNAVKIIQSLRDLENVFSLCTFHRLISPWTPYFLTTADCPFTWDFWCLFSLGCSYWFEMNQWLNYTQTHGGLAQQSLPADRQRRLSASLGKDDEREAEPVNDWKSDNKFVFNTCKYSEDTKEHVKWAYELWNMKTQSGYFQRNSQMIIPGCLFICRKRQKCSQF